MSDHAHYTGATIVTLIDGQRHVSTIEAIIGCGSVATAFLHSGQVVRLASYLVLE